MALHTELPIYKVAYDLLTVANDYVINMPRQVKHAIGNRVTDLCAELVLLIVKANCARDKVPFIDTIIERVSEANMWLRLCQDKKYISKGQYAKAIELASSVGKQANGWKKHYAPPVT